jgi:hypothetical protein
MYDKEYYDKVNKKAQETGGPNFYERYVKKYEEKKADEANEYRKEYRKKNKAVINLITSMNVKARSKPDITKEEMEMYALKHISKKTATYTDDEKKIVVDELERYLKRRF